MREFDIGVLDAGGGDAFARVVPTSQALGEPGKEWICHNCTVGEVVAGILQAKSAASTCRKACFAIRPPAPARWTIFAHFF